MKDERHKKDRIDLLMKGSKQSRVKLFTCTMLAPSPQEICSSHLIRWPNYDGWQTLYSINNTIQGNCSGNLLNVCEISRTEAKSIRSMNSLHGHISSHIENLAHCYSTSFIPTFFLLCMRFDSNAGQFDPLIAVILTLSCDVSNF